MPLNQWKCPTCGEVFRTKQEKPLHCGVLAEKEIVSPEVTYMEKIDPESNKSQLVNQQKILRERARKHSREVDLDSLIQSNEKEVVNKNGWLREDGTKRKGIDDK